MGTLKDDPEGSHRQSAQVQSGLTSTDFSVEQDLANERRKMAFERAEILERSDGQIVDAALRELIERWEVVIPLANGAELRSPGAPMEATYVRLMQDGVEVWRNTAEEMKQDPQSALGLLFWQASGMMNKSPMLERRTQ